jgi:hypothetical protein
VAVNSDLNESLVLTLIPAWCQNGVVVMANRVRTSYASVMAKRKPFQLHLTDYERSILEEAGQVEAAEQGTDSVSLGSVIRSFALQKAKAVLAENPRIPNANRTAAGGKR